jgi:hypothetical protein
MTMLPPGSDLLTDAERQALPPVVVSTDHLSVAEVGVRLAEARAVSMPERLAEVSFDVADVGADLQESRQQPTPALVLEDVVFELAEPGTDMGQARREPPPPAPDVSHLSVLPD